MCFPLPFPSPSRRRPGFFSLLFSNHTPPCRAKIRRCKPCVTLQTHLLVLWIALVNRTVPAQAAAHASGVARKRYVPASHTPPSRPGRGAPSQPRQLFSPLDQRPRLSLPLSWHHPSRGGQPSRPHSVLSPFILIAPLLLTSLLEPLVVVLASGSRRLLGSCFPPPPFFPEPRALARCRRGKRK